VADPIVLHDNINPTGEFPNNVAIHAGFNDTHELKVEGQSLVGQGFAVTGPARKVLVIPPLAFDVNGNLILDLNTITSLATMQAQIAALQAQVASLQNQVTVLNQTTVKLPVINAALGSIGHLTATLSRFDTLALPLTATGALTASLGIPYQIRATFAGAGGGTADAGGPKGLGVVNASATGALTANMIVGRPLGTASMAGISALASSLAYALQVAAPAFSANGTLTADVYRSVMLATANLAGTGSLTATMFRDATFVSVAFNGASGFSASLLRRIPAAAQFAGAGTMTSNIALRASTFDPANTSANVVLSNNNTTITGTTNGQYGTSRGTRSHNSGKYYFEIKLTTLPNPALELVSGGFVNSSFPITTANQFIGGDASFNSFGILGNGGNWGTYAGGNVSFTASALALGDVLMFAADCTAGNMFFGVNGTWIAGIPPTNTLGLYQVPGGTTLYPAAEADFEGSGANALTLNTGGSAFVYPLPTGYIAWG